MLLLSLWYVGAVVDDVAGDDVVYAVRVVSTYVVGYAGYAHAVYGIDCVVVVVSVYMVGFDAAIRVCVVIGCCAAGVCVTGVVVGVDTCDDGVRVVVYADIGCATVVAGDVGIRCCCWLC